MSVTTPEGFSAGGVTAGLKPSGTPDLALVVNHGPHKAAAGVFTSNRVQAAPVVWSRQVLADHSLQAVILNSGGANACTGPDGFADTHRTAEQVAACSAGAGPRRGRDRRRRLLHRSDRRPAADGQDHRGDPHPGGRTWPSTAGTQRPRRS